MFKLRDLKIQLTLFSAWEPGAGVSDRDTNIAISEEPRQIIDLIRAELISASNLMTRGRQNLLGEGFVLGSNDRGSFILICRRWWQLIMEMADRARARKAKDRAVCSPRDMIYYLIYRIMFPFVVRAYLQNNSLISHGDISTGLLYILK